MEEAQGELKELDAIAEEHGAKLAFRLCQESDDVEPVFVRAVADGEGALLLNLSDLDGISLGSYVVPVAHIARALGLESTSPHPA